MPDGVRVQVRSKESDADSIRDVLPPKCTITAPMTNCLPGCDATHSAGQSNTKSTVLPFFVIAVIVLLCVIPAAALAAPLSQSQLATLALRCAPTVPAETLEAVARTESGLDPWALHDNTTGERREASSLEPAVVEASQWLGRGDSVDIGLMQINAANLHALGLTVADALDPCASLAAGAAVLQAAYGGGTTQAEQQAALLIALSRYNTGTPFQGIMNGYAHTVLKNAENGEDELPVLPSSEQTFPLTNPNVPPSWNVSAVGTYAQQHGALWIIDLTPVSATVGVLPVAPLMAAVREQVPAESVTSFSTLSTTR